LFFFVIYFGFFSKPITEKNKEIYAEIKPIIRPDLLVFLVVVIFFSLFFFFIISFYFLDGEVLREGEEKGRRGERGDGGGIGIGRKGKREREEAPTWTTVGMDTGGGRRDGDCEKVTLWSVCAELWSGGSEG